MSKEGEERMRMALETELIADSEGTLRESIRSTNAHHLDEIEKALRAGAAPQRYEELNTMRTGLKAANLILEATWSHYHG